jgi:imidazoleglycerol-phosphate dehydratase
MRTGSVSRNTKETEVAVKIILDGSGIAKVNTGIKFLDHLLNSFAKHGCFDLTVKARGDLEHHIAEDVIIALGEALDKALGNKSGIRRMGDAIVPMDDALVLVAVDLGGRAYAETEAKFSKKKLDDLSSDLIEHLLQTLATNAKLNLHTQVIRGRNDHHIAEAMFKALGIALAKAVSRDPRRAGVPSTKGVI